MVKLPIDNTVFAVVEFVANRAVFAESARVATLDLNAIFAKLAFAAKNAVLATSEL